MAFLSSKRVIAAQSRELEACVAARDMNGAVFGCCITRGNWRGGTSQHAYGTFMGLKNDKKNIAGSGFSILVQDVNAVFKTDLRTKFGTKSWIRNLLSFSAAAPCLESTNSALNAQPLKTTIPPFSPWVSQKLLSASEKNWKNYPQDEHGLVSFPFAS